MGEVIKGRNRSVRVEAGKVVEILPGDPSSSRIVVPKSIDLNVKNSESVLNLSCAARNGGVDRCVMIPAIKPIYNKLHLSYNLKRANEVGFPLMVAVEGIVTENGEKRLTELATLYKKGAKGIFIRSDEPLHLIERVFQYGELLQIPVFVEPFNRGWSYGVMHEGEWAYRLGVPGIPRYAESAEVAKILELASHFDVKVVFLSISTADSIKLLKDHPSNIWVDVTIDNLYFTDQSLEKFNTLFKTLPPLREERDREALLEGIEEGVVTSISSNHIAALEKDLPLEEAEAGISKLDIFTQLAYSLPFPPEKIEELVARNPAKLMGLEWKVEGDNFLVLEEGEFEVDPSRFCSRAKRTPYTRLKYQIVKRG